MFKKNFLHIRTNKAIKKSKAIQRNTKPYSQAKNIGIIFSLDNPTKLDLLKPFLKKLKADKKKVQVLCFKEKRDKNTSLNFESFTQKNISFWGAITSDNVHKFVLEDFDYLINIDLVPDAFVSYILAKSKALCRIGNFAEQKDPLFEMMIKLGENEGLQRLLDEMFHYINELD